MFRGLSLQKGYPQPLSALRMGVHFIGTDIDNEEAEKNAEKWGLVWNPEEGPVWGNTEIFEAAEENDTWTQLIKAGVNGIIKELDGDEPDIFLVCHRVYWYLVNEQTETNISFYTLVFFTVGLISNE